MEVVDILYLSIEHLFQLRDICSEELLLNVLGTYCNTYEVILSNKEKPSGLWCINHFLKEPPVHRINKVRVFVAFSFLGGFFKFEDDKDIFGDMNLLAELLKKQYITQEEYTEFTEQIFNDRNGISPLSFDIYQ